MEQLPAPLDGPSVLIGFPRCRRPRNDEQSHSAECTTAERGQSPGVGVRARQCPSRAKARLSRRPGRGPNPIIPAEAPRDQFAALIPVDERVLGPEHPETLSTRGHLAGLSGRAGDPAGARDQFAALIPVDERVLGPEHPDTLTARDGLTYWTNCSGR